jgi:hypothetical protein
MSSLWRLWSQDDGVVAVEDLTPQQWTAIQDAAGFRGVSGRRADSLVADEQGHLWVIDSTGHAHAVDQMRFVGVGADCPVTTGETP